MKNREVDNCKSNKIKEIQNKDSMKIRKDIGL